MSALVTDLSWTSTIPMDVPPGCHTLLQMLKLQKKVYIFLLFQQDISLEALETFVLM